MIYYMYSLDLDYVPLPQEPTVQSLMCQAAEDPSKADDTPELSPVVLAAKLYGIAGKYTVVGLQDASLKRFLIEIREPLSVSELILLADIIYETTAGSQKDEELRKWVVWRVQNAGKTLNDSAEFLELIYRQPDLARDVLTKYGARNYVWCPDCRKYINLECCRCGWSGLCGRATCQTGDLTILNCTSCRANGHLQLRRPLTDDVESDVLEMNSSRRQD